MKKVLIIGIIFLIISCKPQENNDPSKQIEEYRNLVREYNQKISELEQQLINEDTANNAEIRSIKVETKKIVPEEFSSFFETSGKLEAVNDAYISPEINGQIKQISVSRGQTVRKGQLLIQLTTEVTKNNIDEVKTSLELASKVYEKQKQLWEKGVGSEIQYLEARNNKESLEARLATLQSQLDMAFIKAPFKGKVEEVIVKTGELASPGMRLIRLVNLDEMRVTAQVSESFLQNVSEGEAVDLTFLSLSDFTLKKKINRVGSVIDPVTRTFKVEVLLENPDHLLKPNMLVSMRIQDYYDKDALLVPSIILKDDFKGTFLFRVIEDDGSLTAEKVYVKTGKTVQDVTKILDGISENDLVIVTGYNLVSDGSHVEITE